MNLWWGLVYVELHHSELFGLLSVSCMHWPFLPSGLAQLNTSSVPDWQHSYSPKDRGATFLEVSPQSLFSHWHRDYCSSTVKAYSIMVGNASAAPALAVVWDDSICHQSWLVPVSWNASSSRGSHVELWCEKSIDRLPYVIDLRRKRKWVQSVKYNLILNGFLGQPCFSWPLSSVWLSSVMRPAVKTIPHTTACMRRGVKKIWFGSRSNII